MAGLRFPKRRAPGLTDRYLFFNNLLMEESMAGDGFQAALEKRSQGRRLARPEALALVEEITPSRVHALGQAALADRLRRFGDKATYVFNMHINPANICAMGCTFCN